MRTHLSLIFRATDFLVWPDLLTFDNSICSHCKAIFWEDCLFIWWSIQTLNFSNSKFHNHLLLYHLKTKFGIKSLSEALHVFCAMSEMLTTPFERLFRRSVEFRNERQRAPPPCNTSVRPVWCLLWWTQPFPIATQASYSSSSVGHALASSDQSSPRWESQLLCAIGNIS